MAMKIGTRASPLALTQCRMVAALLARATAKDLAIFRWRRLSPAATG